MAEKDTRRADIVVFWTRRESECSVCREELPSGSFLLLEDRTALCMECADLDHLVFLPRGDAALTRRASKRSRLRAVVVRWSRSRKRYERQGILVEEGALRSAEEECLSDAEAREARRRRDAERRERADQEYVRRFARAIRERYPGCPEGIELEIAERACRRSSGRVGRTAAAMRLDPAALEAAVNAHVRHALTPYDEHLMAGLDRAEARREVGDEVGAILASWCR